MPHITSNIFNQINKNNIKIMRTKIVAIDMTFVDCQTKIAYMMIFFDYDRLEPFGLRISLNTFLHLIFLCSHRIARHSWRCALVDWSLNYHLLKAS